MVESQVFLYIMPGRWYMASLVKTEFRGTLWDGATLVDNPAPGQNAYVCDPGVKSCFGRTGVQVSYRAITQILLLRNIKDKIDVFLESV